MRHISNSIRHFCKHNSHNVTIYILKMWKKSVSGPRQNPSFGGNLVKNMSFSGQTDEIVFHQTSDDSAGSYSKAHGAQRDVSSLGYISISLSRCRCLAMTKNIYLIHRSRHDVRDNSGLIRQTICSNTNHFSCNERVNMTYGMKQSSCGWHSCLYVLYYCEINYLSSQANIRHPAIVI